MIEKTKLTHVIIKLKFNKKIKFCLSCIHITYQGIITNFISSAIVKNHILAKPDPIPFIPSNQLSAFIISINQTNDKKIHIA